MNAHVATGIRELAAQELDLVTGGRIIDQDPSMGIAQAWITGMAIGAVICGLWDWLFG
jgi:hypothetical protein